MMDNSINPILMANWQLVEDITDKLPVWHELIYQGDKATVVGRFQQVDHFMHNDVFQAFPGFFGQLSIQADASSVRVATAPPGFHQLHKEVGHMHIQLRLPFGNQRQDGGFQLLPEPSLQYFLSLLLVGARANLKEQGAVFELHNRREVGFYHFEQVALAPDVVALTIQVLTRGLALLFQEFLLLALDPVQFCNRIQAESIEAHAGGRRYADPAIGRIDAQMDILDVLEDHIYQYSTNIELIGH